MTQAKNAPASRYELLVGYLASDPDNLSLIADAASAAWTEGWPTEAVALVERHAGIAPPPPSLISLLGLAALTEGRHEEAAAVFASLLAAAPEDAALRYNLAWAKGKMGDHVGALESLGSMAGSPHAAALTVRSLHHLERLDDALAVGAAWEDQAGSTELWGALAAVAIDLEELERARHWAARAGDNPDGLAALGTLALADRETEAAQVFFERALAARPDLARGQLGLGSVLLSTDRPGEAAKLFDSAAETFVDHLGSWVAAGWAWLIAGEAGLARARFETAVALDGTFGEAHGGLAVLDVMDGRIEDARRRAQLARRLDREGLGGALASMLMLDLAGATSGAERIRERALDASVGPGGLTIRRLLTLRGARVRLAN